MKITVVGMGYVGLSIAVLFAKNNHVIGLDVLQHRVNMINNKKSPFADQVLEKELCQNNLNLVATDNAKEAMTEADFVVIAVPTDFCDETKRFDMSEVEIVINQVLQFAPESTIVIKSTVPIGYTQNLCKQKGKEDILFSPEFLREGFALFDTLYPSRIIVGVQQKNSYAFSKAQLFAKLLVEGSLKNNIPVLFMETKEAEAVKLFSNSYLALRIGFFNEVDMFAESEALDARQIIEGMSFDSRIGDYYNNPSFGYGGYCLPKDTKQLIADYKSIPQTLISATVQSNENRIQFIAAQIRNMLMHKKTAAPPVLGVYRLAMKSNSSNCRESSTLKVLEKLEDFDCRILIYDPLYYQYGQVIDRYETCFDLNTFKQTSDIIITNRWDDSLADVLEKVYTRDLFHSN